METAASESKPSAVKSSLFGTAIGTGVLLLSLVAGLLFGSWNVGEFLSHLTAETVGWFLLLSGTVVATFAVPTALYLYARLVAPLVLLGVVVVGWLAIGISSGIIEAGAIFGLGLYAVGLSPLYVVLYLVLGGGEYYARKRRSR